MDIGTCMPYHNECACLGVLDIGPLTLGIRTSVLDIVTLKDIRNIACCMTLLGHEQNQTFTFFKKYKLLQMQNNFKNTHCCKCKNILNFFYTILSGTQSECQAVCIHIRRNVLPVLIWVQTVCEDY